MEYGHILLNNKNIVYLEVRIIYEINIIQTLFVLRSRLRWTILIIID